MTAPPRTVSGKWLILGFFAVALVMASSAWAFYFRQQRRPLELWGAEAATLIVQAPQVEAWRLSADVESGIPEGDRHSIAVESSRLRIVERRDIASARGLLHFRKGLLNDRCFDWNAKTPAPPDAWRYGLRFNGGGSQATLLFAPDSQRVRLWERGAEVSIAPISAGLATFLQEQFPEELP